MIARGATRRPLIGITAGRTIMETSVGPLAHFVQPVFYAEAVLGAGGDPIILPPVEGWHEQLLAMVDGLLITGGEDIDPAQYEQRRHPSVIRTDPFRDRFEIAVARFALNQDLPLLGICRGSQVINVAAGGTLVQDLPSQQPSSIAHAQPDMTKLAHEVVIASESRLHAILGLDRLSVNSAHHQAVESVAPPLRPVAWAGDGVIEGMESPARRWVVAVQWHPEMLYAGDQVQKRLFEAFMEAARRQRDVEQKGGEGDQS